MRGIAVRRAADRFRTSAEGRSTWHSFSFGGHYDPADVRHGALLAHNDELLAPGAGYEPHRHRGVEIVTWVVGGRLRHEDRDGTTVLGPGTVQVSTAGTGIEHAERNADDADGVPVRFVQSWLELSDPDVPPGLGRRDVNDLLASGGLVPVASGDPDVPAPLGLTPRATLLVGRPTVGQQVTVPAAPYAQVFLTRGEVQLEGAGRLGPGDAARLTGSGPLGLTAGPRTEVLVWLMAETQPVG